MFRDPDDVSTRAAYVFFFIRQIVGREHRRMRARRVRMLEQRHFRRHDALTRPVRRIDATRNGCHRCYEQVGRKLVPQEGRFQPNGP